MDSANAGAGLGVSKKEIASGQSGHLSEGSKKAPLTVNKLRGSKGLLISLCRRFALAMW